MKIGLIAGGGQFPLLFARQAVKNGYGVHCVAYVNEASKELGRIVDSIKWLHLGQLSKLVNYFKGHGITEAVLLGTVKKTRIFSDIKPDFKALSFIARVGGAGATHDDSILTAFSDLLEKEGITIKASTFLLPGLIAKPGCWTKTKPDRAAKKDIRVGWKITREIGKLDIGQCVVINNGTVLAVEAADGTDATIRRGGGLSPGGAVVIKLSKPGQDLRFDLPSTGTDTIRTMIEAGASVLVIEAGKSLAFDRKAMIQLADDNHIAILAMDGEEMA